MKQDCNFYHDYWFFTSETNPTFGKIGFCEPRGKEFLNYIYFIYIYIVYRHTHKVSRNWLVNIPHTNFKEGRQQWNINCVFMQMSLKYL